MVDAHCHIDLYPNPQAVIAAAARQRVTVVAVTNLPSHYEMGIPYVRGERHIKLALGLHPLLANRHKDELDLFAKLAPNASFIGEIGLDFSREGVATKTQQIASFRFILETLSDRPRFVTIHSRRAEETVLDLLAEYEIESAVLHWFTGTTASLERAIAQGLYLSINPAMTASPRGKVIIESLPRERVLTETDGPHIQVLQRPANPGDIRSVEEYLAGLWGVSIEEAERQVHHNLGTILNRMRAPSGEMVEGSATA